MSATAPPTAAVPSPRQRFASAVRAALEALVLLLAAFAPWPFGSVHPFFEFVLLGGVAGVLALWGLAILLDGRVAWKRCPVALCLAGLVLLGVAQLAPLPPAALRVLSPAGVGLLHELKPAAPETLKSGGPYGPVEHAAGATLSLYPGATRLAVLRLLAVFLLFAAVRNGYASKESLRRLALVSLVNGAALSLFALAQFFTTPQPHVIFWNQPTGGQVFGPFINRNHFAFYVNVCAGLTGGLLAGYWLGRRDLRAAGWSAVLQHPPTLWLGVFLALMLVGLAFCLSRGGLASLALGCVAVVAVRWRDTPGRSWRGPAWAAALLTGFGLLAWYVLPRVEPRLATLWHTGAAEARLSIWRSALAVGRDYPLAGSGYGTFRFLELSRRSGEPDAALEALAGPAGAGDDDLRLIAGFAHNDYLEALAEGGVVRLALSVAAVALVIVLGLRAYRRYRGHPAGGWVLGALAAFVAVAAHSFFDFGLHIPAVAFLTAVLAAHVAALGARRTPDNRPEEYELRLFGVGPPLAAAALLLGAATLAAEGWRLSQAERFRLAAEYRDLQPDVAKESHAPQVAYLEAAVRYEPSDAALRLALGEAHLWQAEHTDEPGHRAAAARQLLVARDLCPLMRQPQALLAALADEFASPDPPRVYLERATRLAPTDPGLWYLLGVAEQEGGDAEAAWRSWRRSLELSDRHLSDIVKRLGGKAGPQTKGADEELRRTLREQPDYAAARSAVR
jgi:O-antigen ligase